MKVIKHKDKWYLQSETGYKEILLSTNDSLIKDGVQAIDDEFLEFFIKNPSCERVEIVFNNRGITGIEKILKTFGEYKIIIPKEEQCTCKEHDPYCCQIHGNCPTCVKKEEPKQLNSEDFGLPKFGTKEFNDLASGLFGGKPKQEKLTYTESAKKEERISNSIMMKRKQETVEDAAEKIYPHHKGLTTTASNRIMLRRCAWIKGAEWVQERMYSEEEVNDLLEMLKRSISEINHLKYTYKDKGHCGKYLSDCETIIDQFKKK